MKKIFFTLLSFIVCYLSHGQTWTRVADMPIAREGANSFVINGKVYIGGGVNAQFNFVNDFYEYDPGTNTWNQKANMPQVIGGSACFTLNGKGYMVCGGDNNGLIGKTFQYDPVLNQWNIKNNFPGVAREN